MPKPTNSHQVITIFLILNPPPPTSHLIIPINSSHPLTLLNIRPILAPHIPRRIIVTHRKIRREVTRQALNPAFLAAVLRRTPDVLGARPDDLAEMAPVCEVGKVRVGLAVVGRQEVVDFAVVELAGDDVGDAGARRAGGDVLAVRAAVADGAEGAGVRMDGG
jgi:hypothetical protein